MTELDSTKACTLCLNVYPVTAKYFHRAGGRLAPRCRACRTSEKNRHIVLAKMFTPDGKKHCLSCDKDLPATSEYFYRESRKKDGWQGECKECSGRRSSVRWAKCTESELELARAEKRRYFRSLTPEQSKRHAENVRRNYEANREEILEYKRLHSKRYGPQYRIDNRELVYAKNRNRRAKSKNAPGLHNEVDILTIYERQQGRCFYCNERLEKYHVDHLTPLSRGGSNYPENLCCTCANCNLRKGALTQQEFEEIIRKDGG